MVGGDGRGRGGRAYCSQLDQLCSESNLGKAAGGIGAGER